MIDKKTIKSVIRRFAASEYTDSPYMNSPIYETRITPSDTKDIIQNGPPAMTNEPGQSDRSNLKNYIQFQQGLRPQVDSLINHSTLPITNTILGDPKTDAQGDPHNYSSPGDVEDKNRDTIGFNPGEWTDPKIDAVPSGWNDPYHNK